MKLPNSINFDFDGTIYPLYTEVENWLPRIESECKTVFTENKAMTDLKEVRQLLLEVKQFGVEVNALTWLPMDATERYQQDTTDQKRRWAQQQLGLDVFDNFFAIPYGTPKHTVPAKRKSMLLFDDNKEVRQAWNTPIQRFSIDPQENVIIETLQEILNRYKDLTSS